MDNFTGGGSVYEIFEFYNLPPHPLGHKIVRLDTQQSLMQSCLSLPFAVNIKLKCFFRQKNKSQNNTQRTSEFFNIQTIFIYPLTPSSPTPTQVYPTQRDSILSEKMGSGASKPEKDNIAKAITGKERPVDAADSVDGRTMLHNAVIAGDVEAVRFLVKNGAGNVRDRDGKVPLWYALQHRDADVRGRLEAELGAHAAEILVEVEVAVERYLTDGVATGEASERSRHVTSDKNTDAAAGRPGEDDVEALRRTDGRKVEWLRKEENHTSSNNSSGGQDLLCWLRGLPNVDPPLGYTDEHVRHMEAGFRVVCRRLLEDIASRTKSSTAGKRKKSMGTHGGHVEVEDWMAARDPFELLLSGFLFTSDCVEYVLDSGGDVVCDEKGTPQIAKGPDGKLRYIRLTERAVLDNHGSAADSQSLALYMTMNTAMRAVGWLPAVKEWKGTTAPNVFELSPAPPQLHVIATFAPLIRGLDRLIGSRRKQLRTVFRGINVNVSAKYALNTHIVWNCFTSTTLKRDVAQSFMYGKGGTFFVVVAKEGAADVKFSSVYASEDELLYTANIEYRVQWKLSPTLLRMMGLRFDVIVMQEVCSGVGETSPAEQVGALQEVMGHTVAFFEDYLTQYVEGRVGDDTRVDESETRPLMEEVRRWLRTRGGVKRASAACTESGVDTKKGAVQRKKVKPIKKKKNSTAEGKIETKGIRPRPVASGVLCVIGEGGSGKTSASIAILSDLATSARKSGKTSSEDTNRNRNSVVAADAKPYFPVFVALPTVKQHLLEKGGLDRFVLESFALREADRAYLAETYEVVLVLDSLDEVGLTKEDVRAVVAEGGLLCRHPWVEAHCSVVVTVRGEYLKGVDTSPSGVCGAGVCAVYMQPFTEVDARTYIKRANTAWEKEHKEEKKKADLMVFVREEDIEGLVQLRNPFVLHMACHAQCSGKASEEVIYETYLKTWTKKEMASSGVAVSDVSLEDVVRAGELVACRMLETNEWQGTVGVASEVLDSQHSVCEGVRDACFRCLPFRIEDFGEERSAFTFRHKSLGEHLAARRLARDPAGTLKTLVQRSFSKDSQRVLGFFAALVWAESELYERASRALLAAVKGTRKGAGESAGSNAAALLARARIPLSGEDLSGIRLSNCDLRGSLFVETVLTGTSFSNCWLEHTEFHTCDMGGTMLPNCSLGTPLPPLRFESVVLAVAVTPDGSQIVTGCGDNFVSIWDISNASEVARMPGHTDEIFAVAVTPDGSRVVSCSRDMTVRVWDIRGAQELLAIEVMSQVFDVAVTPDSTKAVACAHDRTVRVWDLTTGKEVLLIKGEGHHVAVVVTPDGSQLVSCSGNVLLVWDLASGKQVLQMAGHEGNVNAVAVTPDGAHVVSGADDNTARVWNVCRGEEVMLFQGKLPFTAVAVTPDGCHAVVASQSYNMHVWSVATGKEVMVLQGHTKKVTKVAVTPDGCHVVSCSHDCTVRMWNVTSGKEALRSERHSAPVQGVAVLPNGDVVSCCGNTVRVWSSCSGQQTQLFEGHTGADLQVAAFADGSHVVSCSADKTVRVWNVHTGRQVRMFKTPHQPLSVAVTPDASHIVLSLDPETVRVWSLSKGEGEGAVFQGHAGDVIGVAVTPDGSHVVSCGYDMTVRMWKLHTGEETMVFKGHRNAVSGVAVTPDGSRLVSCSWDKTVRVWDVASGKEVLSLVGNSSFVHGVAVTPDGSRVVSCAKDGAVRVWSIVNGLEVAALKFSCPLYSVAVSPDGHDVVCGCADKTVRVWSIAAGLRLKKVLGLPHTVPHVSECKNVGTVEPELARRILLGQ